MHTQSVVAQQLTGLNDVGRKITVLSKLRKQFILAGIPITPANVCNDFGPDAVPHIAQEIELQPPCGADSIPIDPLGHTAMT